MRAGQHCREHHMWQVGQSTKRMAFYDFLDRFALRASVQTFDTFAMIHGRALGVKC